MMGLSKLFSWPRTLLEQREDARVEAIEALRRPARHNLAPIRGLKEVSCLFKPF